MSHLGPRVAALVDGELAPDAAARAHAHAASCPSCLAAVEAERQVRERLSTATDPQVPAGLTAALLAMGGPSGPLPPRPGHVPGGRRPEALSIRPPAGRPDPGPGRVASRRHPTLLRRAERTPAAITGGLGPGGGRRGSGTGPGRATRRRLAAVVAGSFSLASVGLFSVVVLTGALDDGTTAPVTTQLTVDPRSGTRPTAVSVSRSTSQPLPSLPSPAAPASAPPAPTLPSVFATSTPAPSATTTTGP